MHLPGNPDYSIFMEESRHPENFELLKAGEDFLDCLARGQGVEGLLKKAHQYLHMPIHVLDPSFQLIKSFGGDRLDDPRWREYENKGTISDDQLERLKQSGFMEKVQTRREPQIDSSYPGMKVIGCDIIGQSRILGRLGVWCTQSCGDREFRIVRLLINALSAEMQKRQSSVLDLARQSDYFLNKILSQKLTDPETISGLAKRYEILIAPAMMLLILQPQPGREGQSTPEHLKRKIASLRSMLMTTALGQSVISVVDSRGWETPEKREELLKSVPHVRIGFSRVFRSVADILEAYRQATAALELNNGQVNPGSYEDVFFQDLILLSSKTLKRPESLCSPWMLKLYENDRESGNEYVKTLETFILHSGNMKKTADVLNIHYNTMKYRMDMIRKIAEREFNTHIELFKAYLSILVLKDKDLK